MRHVWRSLTSTAKQRPRLALFFVGILLIPVAIVVLSLTEGHTDWRPVWFGIPAALVAAFVGLPPRHPAQPRNSGDA